jgi:methionyl-tRNA synthetase
MDWGIDYPGEDDLVLYVWVDAPIEYVSSTKQYSERVGKEEYDWEEVWGRDGGDGGEIVHVIGRDIIQHHTIFWPAMLHATGHAEPRAVCATGFVTIDGKGLSTSRNRAIWAEEYLDEGFHPDLLRYYLTTMGGFQQDLDFTWERFQERVNGELVGTVGNFVYRSMLFAARNFDGTPDADVSDDVQAEIEEAVDAFENAVTNYDVRNAGDAAVELAQFGNEYIQQHEPWQLEDGSDEQAGVIRDCLQVATAVAVLLEPICPEKAETVWDQLNVDADVHAAGTDAVDAEPGAFDEPDELFEKIEDDRVDELDAALEAKIEEATADDDEDESEEDTGMDDSELEPLIDERIDFDTFEGLDIRVGRIESAEGIEGADKLMRLEVDIGVETRQIVAGLKQLHDADELEGESVIVLANLEQAELFGVESNGMVLAAGEEADLLTTKAGSEPGTKVR